jgi:chromosomal replication initiation ATPase DnaA
VNDQPAPSPACLACAALETRVANIEAAMLGLRQAGYDPMGLEHNKIIADCTLAFDVSVDEITGPSRNAQVFHARAAAYWVLRTVLRWSTPRIARRLKRRCHSAVVSGLKRANELRLADPEFRRVTNDLVELAAARS